MGDMSESYPTSRVGLNSLEEVESQLALIENGSDFDRLSCSDCSETASPERGQASPEAIDKRETVGVGQYVANDCRILQIYKRLPHRKHHNEPGCYHLYLTLYRFWKATEEVVVDFSALGALIRTQAPGLLEKYPQPQLSGFLRKMKKLGFAVNISDKGGRVDFRPMIEEINKIEFNDELDRMIKLEKRDALESISPLILRDAMGH